MTRTIFRTFLAVVLALTLGVQRASAQGPCHARHFAVRLQSARQPRFERQNRLVRRRRRCRGGARRLHRVAAVPGRRSAACRRSRRPADPPPIQPVNLPPPGGGAGAPSAGKSTPKGTTTVAQGIQPAAARRPLRAQRGDPRRPVERVGGAAQCDRGPPCHDPHGDADLPAYRAPAVPLADRRRHQRPRHDPQRGGRERRSPARSRTILFPLAQDQLPQMNSDQYAPERLNLPEAHKLATGSRVLVAVIDSGIDVVARGPRRRGGAQLRRRCGRYQRWRRQYHRQYRRTASARHRHGRRDRGAAQRARHGAARRRAGGARLRSAHAQRRGHHLQHHQGHRMGGRERRPRHQYELCRTGRSAPAPTFSIGPRSAASC